MKRSCGILLPVFSLPSPHGVGTLGKAAYEFIDFLHNAGQSYWQMLPLCQTGFGDSPYQSVSTYAGNPYFIDLDMLVERGLLMPNELPPEPANARSVDYDALAATRPALLRLAYARGFAPEQAEVTRFAEQNAHWLCDYALFMALKGRFEGKPWTQWPNAVKLRDSAAIAELRAELKDEINYHIYVQYLFFGQFDAMKKYASSRGVGLIGDLPIYVAMDSADVWTHRGLFCLDERGVPTAVAGVPPDYFSEGGQLWGNPLYRWEEMAKDGYAWWLSRIAGACALYDALRIDHFRGLSSYWAVPYGAEDARGGSWQKGPGMELISAIKARFSQFQIIAEDLGCLDEGVLSLLEQSGFPGMKVLEFAFDPNVESEYLPHRYGKNCVCYTGTHDNVPLGGWWEEASGGEVQKAEAYFGLNSAEGRERGMIRGGMGSTAMLFVAQMQDYLGLGAESRTNIPGTIGGNWRWRMLMGEASPKLSQSIAQLARLYGR